LLRANWCGHEHQPDGDKAARLFQRDPHRPLPLVGQLSWRQSRRPGHYRKANSASVWNS